MNNYYSDMTMNYVFETNMEREYLKAEQQIKKTKKESSMMHTK
jgi:hypothetical protein